MKTREELKENAKKQLAGKWGKAVCTYVVISFILGGFTYLLNLVTMLFWVIPVVGVIIGVILSSVCTSALSLVLRVGIAWIFLKMKREQPLDVGDAFLPLKQIRNFWGIFGLLLLIQLPISLLTVFSKYISLEGIYALSILISVILVCATYYVYLIFAMVGYIMHDQPGIGAVATIKRSAALMKGHKGDLFVLQLSFILWILLGVVTCGIALLWITPYMSTTIANFYDDLLEEEQRENSMALPNEMV